MEQRHRERDRDSQIGGQIERERHIVKEDEKKNSCISKCLERINQRLVYHLETKQKLVPKQTGFRCYPSTEDKVTLLLQEIEDCIQEQNAVHAVWIDLQKAFD